MELDDLSNLVIGCAIEVHRFLDPWVAGINFKNTMLNNGIKRFSSDSFVLFVVLTFDFFARRKEFPGAPQTWPDETKINVFSHEGAKARREEIDCLSSS